MSNPAGRLLRILEAGKDFSKDKNCREVWMTLLRIDNKNESLLLSRLGKTMELADEAVTELRQIDSIDSSRYTH